MTLGEYIERHGKAQKRVVARAAGLRWQTVHEIAEGRVTPRVETAKRIETATDGLVTVAELLGISFAARASS